MGGNCQFKGRRAPELAAGQLQHSIDALTSGSVSQLSGLTMGLSDQERTKVFEDWNQGCDTRSQQCQMLRTKP